VKIALWLLILAGLVEWAAAQSTPMRAKVYLRNKQTWDADLKGRRSDFVTMTQVGKTGELDLPASEVLSIEFAVDLDKNPGQEAFIKGDFKTAADAFKSAMLPSFPYMDITNNIAPYTPLLLRCMYFDEQYEDVIVKAGVLEKRLYDQNMRREMALYRIIATIGLKRMDDATKQLEKFGEVKRTDSYAPLYYYAKAAIALHQKRWEDLHEMAGRMVAFHPKDMDWMPAGLYLTAQAYIRTRSYDVADQIVGEVNRFYPSSRWAAMASQLKPEIARRRITDPAAAKDASEGISAESGLVRKETPIDEKPKDPETVRTPLSEEPKNPDQEKQE
jgi:tetratricopeptide (TPR) repeat protein